MSKLRLLNVMVMLLLCLGTIGHTAPSDDRERIQDFKMWKLLSALELSEDQRPKVASLFTEIEKLNRNYMEEKQSVMAKLDPLLEAKDNGQIEHVLNDLGKQGSNYFKKKQDLENSLNKTLTPVQRVAYLKFEMEFPRMLREMLRGGERNADSMSDRPFEKMDRGRPIERNMNRNQW